MYLKTTLRGLEQDTSRRISHEVILQEASKNENLHCKNLGYDI